MAKRSTRIQELREKNDELSCMWGLRSILESCQGRNNRKLISNGRPVNKHVVDNPRKTDQLASFDEECRRIQKEIDLASATVDAGGNLVRENIVKRHQQANLVKTRKRARKNSDKAYQSSSCCLHNAGSLIHQLPSTSAEFSLNKLTLAAILRAVCARTHQEESMLSECFQRKYDHVDEINMQQLQMILNRKFISKDGTSSESKSFSEALEMLNLNKDLLMDFLPDSIKNSHPESLDVRSSGKTTEKGKMNKRLWKKIDYQCEYSSRTSFISQPSDKIVILKPASQSVEHSGNVTCHCSSLQFQRNSSRRVSDAKPTSFFFKEMKRKLIHTFGGTRKELSQFSVDIVTSAKTNEKLCKKQDLKSNWDSDIACVTDTVCKKLEVSSVRLSKKQEFDVILEAKRHLALRLKNLNAVETMTSERSPKTLRRILSSPEHDLWPLSPRRGCSGSVEMRFSPYRSSCPSPLRPNKEVTSWDDYNKYDKMIETTDTNLSSSVPSTVQEAHNIGESKIVKENTISEVPIETKSTNVTRTVQTTDLDSEHEAFPSTVDDFPSTPSSILADNTKYQEEHRSPVSVLEPFFTEDANSPPSITLQTGPGRRLQPLRLDFEECSSNTFPQDLQITSNSCIEEQDHLSQYVHLVMQASRLNWDHLSEITSQPEELLHASLFDEVEFLPTDSYIDPKLLFDHINEVLLQIYQSHFCSLPWLPSLKRRMPLAEVVLDEIMREAEFYLLPWTEKRTLNQIVSKDVAECRSWLDVRVDTEQIVIDVSEDIIDESTLDILLEFLT